jgi:hypothetical protein
LFVDDKTSKDKKYADENASLAWERLRNECEPQPSYSLVKMETQFGHSVVFKLVAQIVD